MLVTFTDFAPTQIALAGDSESRYSPGRTEQSLTGVETGCDSTHQLRMTDFGPTTSRWASSSRVILMWHSAERTAKRRFGALRSINEGLRPTIELGVWRCFIDTVRWRFGIASSLSKNERTCARDHHGVLELSSKTPVRRLERPSVRIVNHECCGR